MPTQRNNLQDEKTLVEGPSLNAKRGGKLHLLGGCQSCQDYRVFSCKPRRRAKCLRSTGILWQEVRLPCSWSQIYLCFYQLKMCSSGKTKPVRLFLARFSIATPTLDAQLAGKVPAHSRKILVGIFVQVI